MTGSGLPAWRRLSGTLRSRRRLTAKLRQIAPLTPWRDRTWADVIGIHGDTLLAAFKIALSAALSWALAQLLFGSPAPIYAPITASFVALITIRASIRDAYQRVIGVIVGILVAIAAGTFLGLHAWSIGIIVGVGFLIGKMLRLQPGAAAQIPITGLLLVGLGGGIGNAETRVLDTLIGAVVAVVVNIVVVPPNRIREARRAVNALAQHAIDSLSDMADGLRTPWTREQAGHWLIDARDTRDLGNTADDEVDTAVESIRLHPDRRNWGGARRGLERAFVRLRVIGTQVTVLARTLRDTADQHATDDGTQPPMPTAAGMLDATAGAVDAFAHAMLDPRADEAAWSVPSEAETAAYAEIATARERIAEIRDDLVGMLEVQLSRGIYLGALVVETERILAELEAGLRRDEVAP